MQYCEKLMKPIWQTLDKAEQENILQQIGKQNDMVWKGMETFSRWGLETTTAVYTYQDSEFVFVPGDTVMLGWNGFVEGMDAETKAFFEADLEDWDLEVDLEVDLETYLKSITSEIRQKTIAPMLVERKPMEIGWEIVEENDSRVQTTFAAELEQGKASIDAGTNMREWVNHFRVKKTENGVQLAIYHDMNKKQVCDMIEKQGGFRLPTMDEWEYLAGGGKRTLFQWGDGMAPYIVKDAEADFDDDLSVDTKGELELPNFFGITIGYDSYCMELIADGLGAKGGDGGCACCGGLMMLNYLICSPYYYDVEIMEDLIDETHCNGDFEFVRRVKTITYNEK